jgi:hypothetical protein
MINAALVFCWARFVAYLSKFTHVVMPKTKSDPNTHFDYWILPEYWIAHFVPTMRRWTSLAFTKEVHTAIRIESSLNYLLISSVFPSHKIHQKSPPLLPNMATSFYFPTRPSGVLNRQVIQATTGMLSNSFREPRLASRLLCLARSWLNIVLRT